MTRPIPCKLVGVGACVPPRVSSEEIEQRHGIPAGWAERYSGVLSRGQATEGGNTDLGVRALRDALNDAGLHPANLDLLICANATYDHAIPNSAAMLKRALLEGQPDPGFATMDVDTTCLSFVTALDVAAHLLDGQRYRTIAMVSSEITSRSLHPNVWETLTLFGDAAAAVILQHDPDSGSAFLGGLLRTWSEGALDTIVRGGGNVHPIRDVPYHPDLHAFHMNGKQLLRLAKKYVPSFLDALWTATGLSQDDIDLFLPHQASKAGLMLFDALIDVPPHRVMRNLETHGNCIAASIPLLLVEAIQSGRLARGHVALLIGTSAGFSVGAVALRY